MKRSIAIGGATNLRPHVRAAVAYIAGRLVSGSMAGSVLDCSQRSFRLLSGTVDNYNINVYDHEKKCRFNGTLNEGSGSLYHHGDQHYVSFKLENGQFTGFDYGSRFHFGGTVSGKSISLYDYEGASYFNYAI